LRTIVPYRVFPDGQGKYLYSVALNVQIAAATPNSPRTKRFEAIIDSGATRCLFHAQIARNLGIDVSAGIREIANGIGGPDEVWMHDLTLFLPGGPVKIKAGFKEGLPVSGLLGISGFFEHFRITFEGDTKQCILERIYYT
jgi:hypothetical protein